MKVRINENLPARYWISLDPENADDCALLVRMHWNTTVNMSHQLVSTPEDGLHLCLFLTAYKTPTIAES